MESDLNLYKAAITEVNEINRELTKINIKTDFDYYDELYTGKIETLLDIKDDVKEKILNETVKNDEIKLLQASQLS